MYITLALQIKLFSVNYPDSKKNKDFVIIQAKRI